MKKVLAAIHDPGAAMMLLPVLRGLSSQVSLTSLTGSFSASRFERAKVPAQALSTSLSLPEANALLDRFSPDVLVTGTSWGSNAEQALRDAAHTRKIPSLTVIDYWANYLLRFGDKPSTGDLVCAVDASMRDELLQCGFKADDIRVTGHPHLEELSAAKGSSKNSGSSKNGELKGLFLSEPNLDPMTAETHPFLPVVRELKSEFPGSLIYWTFKLHPKEKAPNSLHKELVALAASEGISVQIRDDQLPLPEAFKDFDFVAGFQSMGLFEAAAMGLRVVALPSKAQNSSLLSAMKNFGISVGGVNVPRQATAKNAVYAGARAEIERMVLAMATEKAAGGSK